MPRDRATLALAIVMVAAVIIGPFLPAWLRFLGTVALANALVVLGLLLLMRTGLVSFGQGLYYCIGGYAAGVGGKYVGISDAFALLALGIVASAIVASILGLLLCRYREIFFAMFSMAFSMILYGLLSKSQKLGSTDGFNVVSPTFLGFVPDGANVKAWVFGLSVVLCFGIAILLHRHLRSGMGYASEAVRDNEIRVEYLGVSAQRVVWWKFWPQYWQRSAAVFKHSPPVMWDRRWLIGRPPASSSSSPCSAARRMSAQSFLRRSSSS